MGRYASYKESGIDWLGEIPSHWDVSRCKAKFAIKKRIVGYDGPSVLSITQKGIVEKDTESGDGQLASSYANYQWVYPGDFAMNHMDLLTGWVDCSKLEGVTSPDYRVFAPISDDVDRIYFTYLFQHCYSGKVFYGYGQGVSNYGRWRLPADEFKNFYLPCPSLDEQKAIASYLDEKTAEIDSLIVDTEKSIELLEEYRKSVISEAVTKGLKPDEPMKDTGVDWIGEVPEHWGIARIGLFVRFHSGNAIDSADLSDDYSVPVYGGGEIKGYAKQCNLSGSNVLVSRQGATCGTSRYLEGEIWATEHALIATLVRDVHLPWLSYWLGNMNLGTYSMTSAQPGISSSLIESLKLVDVPLAEQKEIAVYLDTIISEIEGLKQRFQARINLLVEYRKSLISEAVTGKFKVSGVE